MTSGKLRVTLIEAKLTRDTEMFSKMDPYAVIEYREEEFRTKTLSNAGKYPKWGESFDLRVKYVGDDMKISVFDEDLTKSDLVGSLEMKVSSLCVESGIKEWFDI